MYDTWLYTHYFYAGRAKINLIAERKNREFEFGEHMINRKENFYRNQRT